MSRRLLLQSILKFREGIKSGTAKVQDIVEDYFKSSGKSVTDEDRAIILNEFAESAPSNVTTLEGVDAVETIMPMGGTKTPFTDQIRKQNPGVEITGKESFSELMEKLGPKEEGIMTIKERFKDSPGIDRREAAEFAKKMREAGIKNKDVKDILINKSNFPGGYLDLEQGKRAATTLARAADMKADTAIKQELLSELDEMKLDRSPRFFKEEFMGYDDFRSAEDAKKIEVNNAIVDDLEKMGVEDDIVMFIMGRAREINKKPFYTSGEDFVDIIKEELDFQGIDYDVEFYKNYFRELKDLMRTTEPRFMYGGVV